MRALSGMRIQAKKYEILEKLKENRSVHAQIVAEAREGYVKKAREALLKKLDQLEKGEVVALEFGLYPPRDHTRVYDTAIKMLELDISDVVVLEDNQVRMLVMDEWDWREDFLHVNANYSGTARKMSEH